MWDTPERRRALLSELVGWDSVSGTPGEAAFAERVADRLREAPGIEVATHDVGDGRSVVTGLWRLDESITDAVVLISHFDTVDTADYGALRPLAGRPEELAAAFATRPEELGPEAAADLASGEWFWGRGSMDMKAGLALHMSLLEQAAHERLPLNLLLVTVPDEEVNSDGMRAAVELLRELQDSRGLRPVLFLNSEPSFPAHPGDPTHYVYSGSIGKLLPAALCYGRETHAGTPLKGLTSPYIASFLVQAIEFSDVFRETAHGEPAPLPVTLEQRDLRDGYLTQTPFRTSVLTNVFVMERTAADVLDTYETVARDAADACMAQYREVCAREGTEPVGELRVLRFDALVAHATASLGAATVAQLLAPSGEGDLREQSIAIADRLLAACPELTPAILVLFAPPYYPPANSSDDPTVAALIERVIEHARDRFGRPVVQAHWFNGISDLSYVARVGEATGWQAYERNTPGYGSTYRVPFEAMAALDAPVLNVGPFGKDPHQRTERLHAASAFEELPVLLWDLVRSLAGIRST
jgi:arginine utilization protein RocB